ncbi:hypothetical protein D3C72_2051800 [compost metagenome]
MFDALHAGCDGYFDRMRREGVRGDVGAPIVGYFNCGSQLRLGKGGDVERAVG